MSDTATPDAPSTPDATVTPLRGSIRDTVAAADDIASELVPVPEWGVSLLVKTMTGHARAKMMASAADPNTGEMDYSKMYPTVIIATCYDPADPSVLAFTEDDISLLNSKSGAVLERLAQVGLRVSGMAGEQSEKDLGKD